MDLLQDTLSLISKLEPATHTVLFFDDPIRVKRSPHTPPDTIQMVNATGGKLFLWTEAEPRWQPMVGPLLVPELVASIYQRLKTCAP